MTPRQLVAFDLVGPDEVADRLGIRANTVSQWRARYGDFPPPDLSISRVPIWEWNTILTWCNTHGRHPAVWAGEVTRQELADAVGMLGKARAQTLEEIQRAADGSSHLLAETLRRPERRALRRRNGRIVSNDGDANGSGEWDWWWSLPADVRGALSPRFSDAPAALSPDQYARGWGEDDTEAAMGRWVAAGLLADAAASLARARVPDLPFDAPTTYDPAALFAPDPDAALYLATTWAQERERCEVAPSDNTCSNPFLSAPF